MTQDLPDEMFRWIVEAMPEAVVYSDREGIIRLWNRGAETIFGYRREDALGHTLELIIPERWRARHWEGYRTVMRTGVTRYGREVLAVPASRSDGARISIEFSIILPRIVMDRCSEPWRSFVTSPRGGSGSRRSGSGW